MRELPIDPSIPFQTISTSLNEENVTFDFHWNSRDEAWYFNLRDAQDNPIVSGVKIVLGIPLARHSPHAFFSRNFFMAFDLSGQKKEAGFDDIGIRVVVLHYTASELQNGTL